MSISGWWRRAGGMHKQAGISMAPLKQFWNWARPAAAAAVHEAAPGAAAVGRQFVRPAVKAELPHALGYTSHVVGGLAGNIAANQADVGPKFDVFGMPVNPIGAAAGAFAGRVAAPWIHANVPQMARAHARQLPGMLMGSFVGSQTAEDIGGPFTWGQVGPEKGFHFNPVGGLLGGALGHQGFRNTTAGQTLFRPAAMSAAGGGLGWTGDWLASTLSGQPQENRLARLGAVGGLGAGFLGNRALNARDTYRRLLHQGMQAQGLAARGRPVGPVLGQMDEAALLRDRFALQRRGQTAKEIARRAAQESGINDWGNVLGRKSNEFLNQSWAGAMDPLAAAQRLGRRVIGLPPTAGRVRPPGPLSQGAQGEVLAGGQPWQGASNVEAGVHGLGHVGKPATAAGMIGRRMGQLGIALPLGYDMAGRVAGLFARKADDWVNRTIVEKHGPMREQAFMDADDWAASRGLLNEQGQFDPTLQVRSNVQQAAAPFLNMMGYNPDQLSGGQQALALSGPALMAAGMASGNPWLGLAGMGTAVAPNFMPQRGQGGGYYPYQQGQYPRSVLGQGFPQRDELAVQNANARRLGDADGAGYL